jgi:hypothetical protein
MLYLLTCTNAAGDDKWHMTVFTEQDRDRVAQTWRDQGRHDIRVNNEPWRPNGA